MPLNPPDTQVVLTHALLIKARSAVIGAVNEWNPRGNRDITDLFAFGGLDGQALDSSGTPSALAPGNLRGQSIEVRRYDIYSSLMEEALGTSNLDMLTDQTVGLELSEHWLPPAKPRFVWTYYDCWFESIGRNLSATGDRVSNVSATIRYRYKRKTDLAAA